MRKVVAQAAPRPLRTSHTIKAGESLASVALKLYGDARFSKLIHTINRADIPTRSDGFSSFAFVSPGQVIVLPTYEESNIFAGHFFTVQSQSKFDLAHFARPAMPSDSIPVAILPSQGSRSPNFSAAGCDSGVQKLLPQLPYLQVGQVPSGKHAVASPAAENNQFACQYIIRKADQISGQNLAQSLDRDSELWSHRMLEQLPSKTSESEVIDMSPPTVKVARLQDQASVAEGPEVVAFSHYCRMIRFDAEGGQSDTIIKLQVLEETRWQTITAYIITEQTSRRLAHYADQEHRAVDIDLPSAVARELSISDLKRNWKEYVRCYLTSQAKVSNFAPDNALLSAC